jgi:hypothetical protein
MEHANQNIKRYICIILAKKYSCVGPVSVHTNRSQHTVYCKCSCKNIDDTPSV